MPDASTSQPAPDITASAECCPVQMRNRRVCGRASWGSVVDGTHFCLMHAPIVKDGSAFQQEFERILNEAGNGVADFTRFVFPISNYDGRQFNAKCIFGGASFLGKITFNRATFSQGATFSLTIRLAVPTRVAAPFDHPDWIFEFKSAFNI
jgi:hypothetical protein